MYIIMQAVEEMLGPHHIARLERLTYASLTRCVHPYLHAFTFAPSSTSCMFAPLLPFYFHILTCKPSTPPVNG